MLVLGFQKQILVNFEMVFIEDSNLLIRNFSFQILNLDFLKQSLKILMEDLSYQMLVIKEQ